MSLTLQSCAQETDDLYDAMEKAVSRSEVHCVLDFVSTHSYVGFVWDGIISLKNEWIILVFPGM